MNLHVSIPEGFREALDRRFDPANAVQSDGTYVIDARCPLCETYNYGGGCDGCPFDKYAFCAELGCDQWLRAVLADSDRHFRFQNYTIEWDETFNHEARAELSWLRHRAKELITWI